MDRPFSLGRQSEVHSQGDLHWNEIQSSTIYKPKYQRFRLHLSTAQYQIVSVMVQACAQSITITVISWNNVESLFCLAQVQKYLQLWFCTTNVN